MSGQPQPPPTLDEQMSLAVKAMASHAAQSERVDRSGWTEDQWIADAQRLMDDIDGSVLSLVNGHVLALLRLAQHVAPDPRIEKVRAYAEMTLDSISLERRLMAQDVRALLDGDPS